METSLSEIFGPFGGMHRYSVMKLSRDDCVANFKIFQLCTVRGADRYAVRNIHCSPSPYHEQVGGKYSQTKSKTELPLLLHTGLPNVFPLPVGAMPTRSRPGQQVISIDFFVQRESKYRHQR